MEYFLDGLDTLPLPDDLWMDDLSVLADAVGCLVGEESSTVFDDLFAADTLCSADNVPKLEDSAAGSIVAKQEGGSRFAVQSVLDPVTPDDQSAPKQHTSPAPKQHNSPAPKQHSPAIKQRKPASKQHKPSPKHHKSVRFYTYDELMCMCVPRIGRLQKHDLKKLACSEGDSIRASPKLIKKLTFTNVLDIMANFKVVDAAKEMRISETRLKTLAREYGISRWLFRKIQSKSKGLYV